MKQIISFKKELPFKTKVSDLTSISLEKEVKVEENTVTGIFYITGDYKMNEGSIAREDFSFELPFDITLDPRYDSNTVEVDIEDFYYDIVGDDTLKVNIDLYIKAEYLKDETSILQEEKHENLDEVTPSEEEILPKEESLGDREDDRQEELSSAEDIIEKEDDMTTDLFSNLDNSETYSTYYVYIVKEEDSVDKILTRYGITKEELEDYNDITDIKIGDKLIIPKCNVK